MNKDLINNEFIMSVSEYGVPHWIPVVGADIRDNLYGFSLLEYSYLYWNLKGMRVYYRISLGEEEREYEFNIKMDLKMEERCCKAPVIQHQKIHRVKDELYEVKLGYNLSKTKIYDEDKKLFSMRLNFEVRSGLNLYRLSTMNEGEERGIEYQGSALNKPIKVYLYCQENINIIELQEMKIEMI